MSLVILALLALAALSLGLRTTAVLTPGVHPVGRLLLSLIIGVVMSLALLEVCRSYRLFEFGLGSLVSLSPVGLFDLAKWWFRWRNGPQRG